MLKIKTIFVLLLLFAFTTSAHAYDPQARQVIVNTTNINGNLSGGCGNLQTCVETIDDLPITRSTSTKTSNYTLTSSDGVILGNTTGSSFSLTLPTAIGFNKMYTIKRIGSGSNNLTINTTSSQTIDGDLTLVLTRPNTSVDLVSDNSNWRIS